MKIVVLGIALMTITAISQAAGLPEGSFRGNGLWKSQEQAGKYEVRAEIKGQAISSTYTLPDGTTRAWAFERKPTGNGFFEVISRDHAIGRGYCLEKVALCHYEVKVGSFELEETLTIQNEKLYKFGSKTEDGTRIMWQESLDK